LTVYSLLPINASCSVSTAGPRSSVFPAEE
jgi:hypothetical protein